MMINFLSKPQFRTESSVTRTHVVTQKIFLGRLIIFFFKNNNTHTYTFIHYYKKA